MSEAGSPFIKFRVIFGNPFYMAHAVFLGVYSAPPSLLSLKHLLFVIHFKPTAMAREVLTTYPMRLPASHLGRYHPYSR